MESRNRSSWRGGCVEIIVSTNEMSFLCEGDQVVIPLIENVRTPCSGVPGTSCTASYHILRRYRDIARYVEPTPGVQSPAAFQVLWRQSTAIQAATLYTYQFCCIQDIASCAAARSERIGSPPCADSEQDSTYPSIQSCSRKISSVTTRLEIWALQQVTQWQGRQLKSIMRLQQQADLHHFGSTPIRPSN